MKTIYAIAVFDVQKIQPPGKLTSPPALNRRIHD